MSYSVYSTRGFILGSAPSGEAGKTYAIYTEQFGLLRAHAQGVRHLKSKLRYNLTDYNFATFSLVRGKEFWRITGAVSEPFATDADSASGGDSVLIRARILNFIRRLVQGEERNDELFAVLLDLFSGSISETRVLARVLSSLGYLDLSALEGMGDRDVVAAINKALRESHL
jgi:recombinational DNA repair protein (RecF pathway)